MCDLNSASVSEIVGALGLDVERARALQLWRYYREWADVERVPGFDPSDVAALRSAGAVLGPAPSLSPPPAFKPRNR